MPVHRPSSCICCGLQHHRFALLCALLARWAHSAGLLAVVCVAASACRAMRTSWSAYSCTCAPHHAGVISRRNGTHSGSQHVVFVSRVLAVGLLASKTWVTRSSACRTKMCVRSRAYHSGRLPRCSSWRTSGVSVRPVASPAVRLIVRRGSFSCLLYTSPSPRD